MGWFRAVEGGHMYKGCQNRTEDGVVGWCPMPGAVDRHTRVALKNQTCKATQGSTPIRRKRSADDSQCQTDTCQQDKVICDVLKQMDSEADKVEVREDMDFVNRAEQAAGWSPLTDDDDYYKNPWVKYKFYQDVLENLDKFSKTCEKKIASGNYPSCSSNNGAMNCDKISLGIRTYETITEDAISELRSLANKLDKAE